MTSVRQLCLGLSLLVGCAGEAGPLLLDQGQPGVFPDSRGPSVDLGGTGQERGGADLRLLDGSGSKPDAGVCSASVPAGTYKGNVTGMATGTITFKLAAGTGGLNFVELGSKMVVDKNGSTVTYPLVLGSLACKALHAALARPPGTTGGTDLRGAIDGTFVAPDSFKGTWNLPGSTTGTFKATLSP